MAHEQQCSMFIVIKIEYAYSHNGIQMDTNIKISFVPVSNMFDNRCMNEVFTNRHLKQTYELNVEKNGKIKMRNE